MMLEWKNSLATILQEKSKPSAVPANSTASECEAHLHDIFLDNAVAYYRDPYVGLKKLKNLGGIKLECPLTIEDAETFKNFHFPKKDVAILLVARERAIGRPVYLRCYQKINEKQVMGDGVPLAPHQCDLMVKKFSESDHVWYQDSGLIFVFRNKADKVLFELTHGFGILKDDDWRQ